MRRIGCLVAGALLAVGCGASGSSKSSGDRLRVVTTTTQLTDFAKVVGGSDVVVYGVLKANVDPHDYEPSPADLQAIADADVIVENGIGIEKWLDKTVASASPHGAIVDTSKGVPVHDHDPHIWHDPRNAKVMVANITSALEKAGPGRAATFQANEAAYDTELDRLDAEIAAEVTPLTNKKIVTNHDAFAYFINRYGLDYVGAVIPSFDTQAELSARDVSDLVAKIRATGVRAVFSESSLPPKTAEAIAGEAGVKVVAGHDALYGDTLGPPGSDGATYLQMMRHNAREIVDNLRA
ncbi:MAG: metal ABC transporter substrate-binding protein [Actinomycetota bacterium]|nr:metal ABC transporter substrate-binding protein [Actinomycetota bacterium]